MARSHRVTHHRAGIRRSVRFPRQRVVEVSPHRGARASLPGKLRAGLLATVVVACWGCEVPGSDPGREVPGTSPEDTREPPAGPTGAVPIIVVLATNPDDGGVEAVRDRLIGRLEASVPSGGFGNFRTFEMLPAIALSAQPNLIAWLLSQPEVASIEPDRTRSPATTAAPGEERDPELAKPSTDTSTKRVERGTSEREPSPTARPDEPKKKDA